MTYTYVVLKVSPSAYEEIKAKLLIAQYNHAINEKEKVIDLHGLALRKDEGPTAASAEEIMEAAAELKQLITDHKAGFLLSLEAALLVGYHMRRAQKNYYAAKTGKQELLIEAKRLENAFDLRLAELKSQGMEFKD